MDNKRISEIVEEEMMKQDANRYRDMRKILTIPKSIADELDLHEINWQDGDLVFRVCNALPCKVEDWFDSDYNSNSGVHSDVLLSGLNKKAHGNVLRKLIF